MAERVVASVELTVASYKKCSRLLKRGEIKRSMQRGPLIGYFLACPACAYACSYVHEDCGVQKGVGYIEDPPTDQPHHGTEPRKLVGMMRPPTCFRCKRVIRVRDGRLETVETDP